MPTKFESRDIVKQKENSESFDEDLPLIGIGEQNESEIRWVKLHQMFDR